MEEKIEVRYEALSADREHVAATGRQVRFKAITVKYIKDNQGEWIDVGALLGIPSVEQEVPSHTSDLIGIFTIEKNKLEAKKQTIDSQIDAQIADNQRMIDELTGIQVVLDERGPLVASPIEE